MSDLHANTPQHSVEPTSPKPHWLQVLRALASDVGIALLWAALVTAIVLFSGVVSQFAYVDF